MTQAIEANRMVVKKGKVTILPELSLTIEKGKITGLIGPSGSGKTTLMRTIVGVQAHSGELTVLGQPAGSAGLRSQIGYVTQSPAVYGDLTVEQNLAYFAAITQATARQVDEVIAAVQLREFSQRLVDSLSGGQRARVSLAVALLGNPDILVLDEPTVGLDPVLREKLWRLFRVLAEQGKTLLVSSHVMDEADRCDNLLLIREGQVLWNKSRTELLKKTHVTTVGAAFIKMIKEADHV